MSQPFEIITDPDVIARREARAKEYGTWECGPEPIEFNGSRAFNEGDPVPLSTVERFGLDKLGKVVEPGTFTKAQQDAAEAREEAERAAVTATLEAQSSTPVADHAPGGESRPSKATKSAKSTTGASEGGN
jgi:hypothetical protein